MGKRIKEVQAALKESGNMIHLSLRTTVLTSALLKDSGIKSYKDVPIADEAKYKTLFGEEGAFFEFISAVKLGEDAPAHPDSWTTVILTPEWGQSFSDSVAEMPKPLFISGHAETGISPKMRAIPDGYVVGGLVRGNIFMLRNALPRQKSELKQALMEQTAKEIDIGMLSTSTSDTMQVSVVVDEEEDEITYYANKSVNRQSNALVEYDQTGSEAEIILTSFKAASLNGERGEKKVGTEDKIVTTKEHFTSLKNQFDAGLISLKDIETGFGVTLMSTEAKTALKRLKDAEEKIGGDITTFIDNQLKQQEDAFIALKDSCIEKVFKTPELIEVADTLFSLKKGTKEDIEAEVKKIASLKFMQGKAGEIASGMNYSGGGNKTITLKTDGDTESEDMEA